LDPIIFGVFASYYTETLLYSNFRGPLFSRTCQAREIRQNKGHAKKPGFTVIMGFNCLQLFLMHSITHFLVVYRRL